MTAPHAPAADALAGMDALSDWQADLYRTIHQHPELAHQEVRTAAMAADALREAGYEVHERIGTTGVVGILRNGEGGDTRASSPPYKQGIHR